MASLLISAFEGLSTEDFEVYAPKCWSNNLHNLDRMRTKDRLMALLGAVQEQVDGAQGLSAAATSEIPSVWNGRKVKDQWAYLIRGTEARNQIFPLLAADMGLAARLQEPADHQRHGVVYVSIDLEGLTVGLTLHKHATIDLKNAVARKDEADLAGLLEAAASAGLTLNGEAPAAATLAARCTQALEGVIDEVTLSRRWPQGEILDFGAGLVDEVKGLFEALIPIYAFIAWSAENDHAGVSDRLSAFAESKARHEAEAEARLAELEEKRAARAAEAQARAAEKAAEMAEWRARRRRARPPMEEMGPSTRSKRPSEDQADASKAEDPEAGGAEAEGAEGATEAPAAPKARPQARPQSRSQGRPQARQPRAPRGERPPRGEKKAGKAPRGKSAKAAEAASASAARPAAALKVGDSCRLLRGLFAGKEGVVAGVEKGLYEVKVGNLQVKVKAQELEAL
ncbi:MAG: hypothetical protein ACE366_00185 [Bradymonadia bacterium]